jgi:hypothetical protein
VIPSQQLKKDASEMKGMKGMKGNKIREKEERK